VLPSCSALSLILLNMAGEWKQGLALKIVNVVCYLLFLGSNIYIVASPQTFYISSKQTFITPAHWAFLVWSLIHLLLLGTVIYQFITKHAKEVIIDGIGFRFALLGVLNAIYFSVWMSHHYVVAFIFALFVSATVSQIYYIVKKNHTAESITDELFVHLPFSLYHGWTLVLVILTAFQAFGVDSATQKPGIWTKVFVFLALFFLEATAAAYSFSSPEGDLPAAAVIAWSLWAIFDRQRTSGFVHWSSLVFAILSLIWVIKGAWGLSKKRTGRGALHLSDEESGPLLHGESS